VELSGLLPEVTGGTDQAGEFRAGNFGKRSGGQKAGLAQISDGARGICPSGVLDQDGADDHFEGGAAGPPVLLAVSLEHCIIIFTEDGEVCHWLWRASMPRASQGRGRCAGTEGVGQSGRVNHLFRKITMAWQQVKNPALSLLPISCSFVQVLANSERWVKNALRRHSLFAILGDGCTISRERCGCQSV
jgi:hypothetical protein